MSTNFYWIPGVEQVLSHAASPLTAFKQLHIGKRSGGWSFTFQGYVFNGSEAEEREIEVTDVLAVNVVIPKPPAFAIKSWVDWKALISSGTIVDEYNRTISFEEFVEMVETALHPTKGFWGTEDQRQPLMNDFDYLVNDRSAAGYRVDPETDWKDAEGYAFSTCSFI